MKCRLKEIREEKELTKRKLATILNVSDSIYARWENSQDTIPTRRIYQLANYYQLNIDYLLGLTDEKITMVSSNKMDISLIATRIVEVRKDFNETLRTFVKRFNTSSSTWSAYETWKTLILGTFLIEVCRIGNYSADWLLGRCDTKYLSKK